MFNKNELNEFYRYCTVLTSNVDDAYDLLQTSLEKFLHSKTDKIISKNNYMRTIIRNQFIDQYRTINKYQFENFDENNITEINEETSLLEEIAINNEEAELVWEILTNSEREIMYLWAIHGLSTTEVAKFLGAPKGTIVSKISRLRKKVVSQLKIDIGLGAA